MAHQVGGVARESSPGVAADVIGVVVEEDILDIGLELLFGAQGADRHDDGRRCSNRHARGGLGRTAFATRHQVIAGRYGWGDGPDARGGHLPDAIDGDASGVCGAPTKLNLVTRRDNGWSNGDLRGRSRRCHRGGGFGGRQRLLLLATCNRDQC